MVVEIDLIEEKDIKTVYVMGTVFAAKWEDLVGVKMYVTTSMVYSVDQL